MKVEKFVFKINYYLNDDLQHPFLVKKNQIHFYFMEEKRKYDIYLNKDII